MSDEEGKIVKKETAKILDEDGFIVHDEKATSASGVESNGDEARRKRRRRKKNRVGQDSSQNNTEEIKARDDAELETPPSEEQVDSSGADSDADNAKEEADTSTQDEKGESNLTEVDQANALAADLEALGEEEETTGETTKKKRRKRRKKGKAGQEDSEQKSEESTDLDTNRTGDGGDSDEPLDRDDELSEEEKLIRKYRRKKAAVIITCSLFGVLLAVYLGMVYYFTNHFYFNTTFNQTVDMSLKSVDEVEGYFSDQVKAYELTIEEKNDKKEIIKGSDIDVSLKRTDEIENCLEEQNPFLWPKSLWEPSDFGKEIEVVYDRNKLATQIKGLDAMNPANQTESISAYPVFKDGQFVAEPEIIGTQINQGKLNDSAGVAIRTFTPTLNVEEAECYIKPKYLTDSEKLVAALAQMNEYLKTEVTYNVPPKTEIVNSEVISQWVSADEDMNVTFDQELVKQYVQGLADKYNTIGKDRTFKTGNGNTVTVEGGDLGWKLNVEEEITALLANIENKEVISRDMVWSQTSGAHGDDNDYGGTYAEVDLSAQHMWFFKDGVMVMDSPVVTGRPSSGHATPQGSYYLTYKKKNAILRAPLRPDGTREYETPVSYWMPFNGGIGFHDATWQPYFGGSRYIGNGSHGCVNMPYNAAAQLYDLMEDSTIVVCHY